RPETMGGFWLLTLAGAGISFLYLYLAKWIGMSSADTVFVMLALQQLVVFSRSFIRNWNYAFAAGFVQEHPVALWTEPASLQGEPEDSAGNRINESVSPASQEPAEEQEE